MDGKVFQDRVRDEASLFIGADGAGQHSFSVNMKGDDGSLLFNEGAVNGDKADHALGIRVTASA